MKTTLPLDVEIKKSLNTVFASGKVDLILPKLRYIDACCYTIEYLTSKLKELKTVDYQKLLDILTNITLDESEVKYLHKDSKKNKKFQYAKVERIYVQLWLAFLKCKLPENIRLDSMLELGDSVLDRVSDPSLFSNVVIRNFEQDRQLGIVTLRSVYKLMLLNQMQYSGIYDVLYGLLTIEIFQSPFCNRFFDDLSVLLSSRSMSHNIATKFIGRLSEMTLTAANHHLTMLVRLVVSLLKRHPGSQCLVHRKKEDDESMNAIRSLLEIKDLQNHFDAEIRNLASEINFKLNDKIDNSLPSVNVEAKQKKISKSRQRITDAIESLMKSNCTLPELAEIENFGTTSLSLF